MSERYDPNPERNDFPEAAFDVATTVSLRNGDTLLLGHTGFGDFRLQKAGVTGADSMDPRIPIDREHPSLQTYHSVEPGILGHVIAHLTAGKTREETTQIIVGILDVEQQLPIGELRYPHHDIDASADRQYNKVYTHIPVAADPAEIPAHTLGHEGSLKGYIYHTPTGITFTDEEWDDDIELEPDADFDDDFAPEVLAEIEEDEDQFDISRIPRKERIIAEIDAADLPAFASALIATARTDYGRVKRQDLIDTLLSALR